MSRDFDRAQEMVVASMEYIKVLGFRIRRTEVQRDDWKQVAQSHADEMIKLRQHVDALKAERDAERKAHDEYKERNRDIFNGNQRLTAELAVIKDERDALRAECDDLENAIDALKKERDELATRLRQSIARGDFAEMRATELTAEIDRLKKPARKHPVAVGEWVLRTGGGGAYPIGTVAQVNQYSPSGDYLVRLAGQTRIVTWFKENCTPCDPPEATHDTPEGKQAAESVIRNDRKTEPDEIKVGDVAKVRSASGNLTAKCNVGQIGEVLKIDSRDGTVLLSGEAGWVDIQDVRKVTT